MGIVCIPEVSESGEYASFWGVFFVLFFWGGGGGGGERGSFRSNLFFCLHSHSCTNTHLCERARTHSRNLLLHAHTQSHSHTHARTHTHYDTRIEPRGMQGSRGYGFMKPESGDRVISITP